MICFASFFNMILWRNIAAGFVGLKVAIGVGVGLSAASAGLDKAKAYWRQADNPSLKLAASVAAGHTAYTACLMMSIPTIYAEEKVGARLGAELHDKIGYGSYHIGGWSCHVTTDEFVMRRGPTH